MFYLEHRYAEEMIAHAREEAPNECCGVLGGKSGQVKKLFRGLNIEKSPVRYNIDPQQLIQIYKELEDNGWDILGIYHSHTHTEAYPSATDIRLAFWPESLYFIISLGKPREPVIRAFTIRDGKIEKEEITIS